jgi:hypothetical protein
MMDKLNKVDKTICILGVSFGILGAVVNYTLDKEIVWALASSLWAFSCCLKVD